MKLKRWLFLSHLLVILTPILIGVLLYNLIVNYNKKIELNDYLTAAVKFKVYEEQLSDPKIYTSSQKNMRFVKKEDENTAQIKLYNSVGQELYVSNEDLLPMQSREILYSDLYKIQQGYKACTLKKPVFDDNVLVGFYQITIARENFIEGVNNKTILAAISHDLKTPLTAIRAYAEAIGNQNDLNLLEIRNKSAIIINKSDYMKKMIDDLMAYTLLTSDYNMEFVEVEGFEFFEMLFSGYDETCEKNNIKLSVETYVDGTYKVDVKQMMRVVDNLMTNAIRYTKEGNQIWMGAFSLNYNLPAWIEDEFKENIKTWKSEGCILIVKNEGKGIKEEEQGKIFRPFYQIDDSRNKTSQSGVGLGLSIVNLVIQKHNGELKLLSQGNSTAFVCWIPDKDIKH